MEKTRLKALLLLTNSKSNLDMNTPGYSGNNRKI